MNRPVRKEAKPVILKLRRPEPKPMQVIRFDIPSLPIGGVLSVEVWSEATAPEHCSALTGTPGLCLRLVLRGGERLDFMSQNSFPE